MSDFDIASEIRALEKRKAQLLRLNRLRAEVRVLESESIRDATSRGAFAIVIDEICKHFGLSFELLISKRRSNDVAIPRQIAFFLIRRLASIPFEQIAEIFEKDHATIMYGCRKMADRISVDRKFSATMTEIEAACRKRMDSSEQTETEHRTEN